MAPSVRYRVLFAGHTRYELPLSPSLARKWDAVAGRLGVRIVGSAGSSSASDVRFRLFHFHGPAILEGTAFYASLPALAASEIQRFRPDVVVAQSPYEGFLLLPALATARRRRPRLVIEVHGDWRTAPRLYGSRMRHAIAALTDRAAACGLRRADATRALTRYTAQLAEDVTGRPPVAVFPTYFDLHSYVREPRVPQPDAPTILWVGVLEHYKNPVGFARSWGIVAERIPEARLHIVGQGRLEAVVQRLVRKYPGRVVHDRWLEPDQLSRAYDAATLLALPSRAEGMGRVIIEAFARGRPVVASDAGGIGDLVRPGHNGLLTPRGDDAAFADALTTVLTDHSLAERLATGAVNDAPRHGWTAERYADAVAAMVERTLT
jgi:glycosyltransferase involved in cell wall biosynthesis